MPELNRYPTTPPTCFWPLANAATLGHHRYPLSTDILAMDQGSTTASGSGDVDPIDPMAWNELQLILGADADSVLRELIDAYLEDAMRLVSSIEVAHLNQDPQAMIMAAHALRSPSASLGARRLASLACEIEEGLRCDPQQWPQLFVHQMLIETGRVCMSLKQRRPVGF
jgi:HPt (histidine-containing phosphotransfer) domain-containing protein